MTPTELETKIAAFVALVTKHRREYFAKNAPIFKDNACAAAKEGSKYIKVDVVEGDNQSHRSGKYMVEVSSGRIFGIKGYGVIHRGKCYGTLDTINDFWWGGHDPVKSGSRGALSEGQIIEGVSASIPPNTVGIYTTAAGKEIFVPAPATRPEWPKHADGTPKKMKELSKDEQLLHAAWSVNQINKEFSGTGINVEFSGEKK